MSSVYLKISSFIPLFYFLFPMLNHVVNMIDRPNLLFNVMYIHIMYDISTAGRTSDRFRTSHTNELTLN